MTECLILARPIESPLPESLAIPIEVLHEIVRRALHWTGSDRTGFAGTGRGLDAVSGAARRRGGARGEVPRAMGRTVAGGLEGAAPRPGLVAADHREGEDFCDDGRQRQRRKTATRPPARSCGSRRPTKASRAAASTAATPTPRKLPPPTANW